MPGGPLKAGMVRDLQDEFIITKDDLRKGGQKNPYKAKMLRDVIIGLVSNVAAAALAVGGVAPAAIAVEAAAGVCALDFARNLKNYFDFKKVQKKYMSGDMDEEEIKGAIMREITAERDKRWSR